MTEYEKTGLETRKKIFKFIVSFINKNSYAPSFREIAKGTDVKSTSTIKRQMDNLKKLGFLMFNPSIARSIVVLKDDGDFI